MPATDHPAGPAAMRPASPPGDGSASPPGDGSASPPGDGSASPPGGSQVSPAGDAPGHPSDDGQAGSPESPVAGIPGTELQRPDLTTLLEAVLLVTDEPVSNVTLARVTEAEVQAVDGALRRLAADYDRARRGFELRAVAGGWRLYTRAACAPWVERFVVDGQQARLTQAALETLAIIAYRQPVTRARVSAVRGVNVDGVVRTLLTRGLVAEVGQDLDSGATLFGTTSLLLEKLGLRSLAELPALAPLLPELDELSEVSMSTGGLDG